MTATRPNSSHTKRNKPWLVGYCSLLVAVLLLSENSVSSIRLPDQTGPYITGVQDFEFTDSKYESDFPKDQAGGRRILFRAWYPVCLKSDLIINNTQSEEAFCTTSSPVTSPKDSGSEKLLGSRRKYFEPGEWEAYFGQPEPTELTQGWDLTQSYQDAPPLDTSEDFPVVIYMHGYGMWVSDNTGLLEEIASHGYTVLALASPGFTSAVLFPDGTVVSAAVDYPHVAEAVTDETIPNPFAPPHSTDLEERHDEMKKYLELTRGTPSVFPRARDDMLALADYIEEEQSSEASSSPQLQQVLGNAGNLKVIYMGFSLGGAAAGSAAQQDTTRAVGSINVDGLHQSIDLFGTAVRVPYLTFAQNSESSPPFYFNEFFFEPLESMGTSPNVTRALMPEGVTHLDFTDTKHFDQSFRDALGMKTTVDGDGLHKILAEFCLGFIDTYLGEKGGNWTASESFDDFDEVTEIDVTYVAEWDPDDTSSSSTVVRGSTFALLGSVLLVVVGIMF